MVWKRRKATRGPKVFYNGTILNIEKLDAHCALRFSSDTPFIYSIKPVRIHQRSEKRSSEQGFKTCVVSYIDCSAKVSKKYSFFLDTDNII